MPAGVIVDATLGGGGHSEAILDSRDDLSVLGLDRDADALAAATDPTRPVRRPADDAPLSVRRARRGDGGCTRSNRSPARCSTSGVSSPQLDRAERGFSYRNDGPLDMRMDADSPWSADDVVNGYPERQLMDVIRRYGDERFATRIAKAIVAARPIESTTRLAEIVTTAIPAPARRTGGHPAKRTFQAIRIEVNGELDVLPEAIDKAIDALAPGGRLAVLSYHSGEDRIVKDRIRRAATGGCECPPELPCVCGAVQTVRIVQRRRQAPDRPSSERNRRAASARFRVAEKIEPTEGAPADGDPTPARNSPASHPAPLPDPFRHQQLAVVAGSPPGRQVRDRADRADLGGVMMGAVFLHTRIAERQLEIDSLERSVRQAQEDFDVLRAQRAELRSLTRLSTEARRARHVPGSRERVRPSRPDGAGGHDRPHRRGADATTRSFRFERHGSTHSISSGWSKRSAPRRHEPTHPAVAPGAPQRHQGATGRCAAIGEQRAGPSSGRRDRHRLVEARAVDPLDDARSASTTFGGSALRAARGRRNGPTRARRPLVRSPRRNAVGGRPRSTDAARPRDAGDVRAARSSPRPRARIAGVRRTPAAACWRDPT